MLLHTLKNPFGVHMLDDTATLPPGDVPDLHAHVLQQCHGALNLVRHTGHGAGVLVIGEAGSGKSHLIAQLRKQLAAEPHTALAAIRLGGAFAGRLWRHLRKNLVNELLRPYPDAAHGENGMMRVLRNRFPKWAAAPDAMGGLMRFLIGSPNAGDTLRKSLDDFTRSCVLDYSFCRVLPQLTEPTLHTLAQQWLRGDPVADDDLKRLGLPAVDATEQEQESRSRDIVLSILALAGDRTTLLICFDEVEKIQAGTHDARSLYEFTSLATELLAETGPRVIATFIRPNLQVAISKAGVDCSNIQKMSQHTVRIAALTWEQCVQIVRFRLHAEPSCRAARQGHASDLDWPLGEPFVRNTFDANHLVITPRHLILACRVEFDRLIKGASPDPPIVPPPPPSPPQPDDFMRLWDNKRNKYLAKLQGLEFDTIMGIGLPWLVELTDMPLVQAHDTDHRLGDITLVFHPKAARRKPLGLSVCNHEPRVLWRRLDRIHKQWTAAKGTILGTLVLVRSEAERTTETAQARFANLQRAGARLILVQRQQLAELAAFQAMLTAALAGDLTRSGKPVDTAEYNTWAGANLSDAVKELLHEVFEANGAAPRAATKSPKAKELTKAAK